MKDLELPDTAMPSPVESAKQAGLRYVMDDRPGISRERKGDGFIYKLPDGKPLEDAEALARIKHLAIPPAWTEVWISPYPHGHLQATGRDARGRKQYRYHADWRSARDENKYGRMIAFGQAIPRIRRRVEKDLQLKGLPRNKVLATLVRLLETTCIRIGNEEYARDNKSFGLTTFRNRHARLHGDTVTFEFRGKSGKRHKIDVRDRQLARVVKSCQDLPDQELFEYLDEEKQPQTVKSDDVNAYIREISGGDFSAKDFRTWAGTVLAAIALREFEQFTSAHQAKSNIVHAIEAVSKMLGNTPSVCRKCYVHPVVLESYLDGVTIATLRQEAEEKLNRRIHHLKPEEAAVMMLLRQKLTAASRKRKPQMKAAEVASADGVPARPAGSKSSPRAQSRDSLAAKTSSTRGARDSIQK